MNLQRWQIYSSIIPITSLYHKIEKEEKTFLSEPDLIELGGQGEYARSMSELDPFKQVLRHRDTRTWQMSLLVPEALSLSPVDSTGLHFSEQTFNIYCCILIYSLLVSFFPHMDFSFIVIPSCFFTQLLRRLSVPSPSPETQSEEANSKRSQEGADPRSCYFLYYFLKWKLFFQKQYGCRLTALNLRWSNDPDREPRTPEQTEIENLCPQSFIMTALEPTPACRCLLQSLPFTTHSTCPPYTTTWRSLNEFCLESGGLSSGHLGPSNTTLILAPQKNSITV